jgi:hypothetical protein
MPSLGVDERAVDDFTLVDRRAADDRLDGASLRGAARTCSRAAGVSMRRC